METPTPTLHRLTSMEAGPRVLRELETADLTRLPWFYKRYETSLPRLALPRDLSPTTAPAVAVLAGSADVAHTELDLPHLSRLLHLSAGVVRTMTAQRHGTWLFRAAGSAGGRFPLESYVAVPNGSRVPAGVGVPEYASPAGGLPGAPTAIRQVRSRVFANKMLAPRVGDQVEDAT